MQLTDAERTKMMKMKDEIERKQREIVMQNQSARERQREQEVKFMIDKTEQKQKNSIDLYQKNLNDKVNLAKTVNEKMDLAAQRVKNHQIRQENKKQKMFDKEWQKFNEKMVIRKELLDWKQEQIRNNNEAEFERHKKQAAQVKERDL